MSTSRQGTSSEPQLKWAPLVLTEQKIPVLWEQIRQFPQLFDDFTEGDFNDFVKKLFNPANVFLDIGPGLGIGAGFAVRPGLDAIVHLVMFDRRLRGREKLFREIMSYFFHALRLQRMTSIIAEDCMTAIKLAQRIGFKEEGIMRKALLRKGKAIDMHILGILREEFDAKDETQSEGPVTLQATENGPVELPLEPVAE